jgi:hypothetical protein
MGLFVFSAIYTNTYHTNDVSAANSFVANNFFSTAVTGYWAGSSISSPLVGFDKPYTEVTQLYDVSSGKYPVHIYVNQPRNISGMQLYSSQSSKIRDDSGEYLYYNWYQIDYEFEVLVFSEARWDDLLKTKPFTSEKVQWYNHFFWDAKEIIAPRFTNDLVGYNNYENLDLYPMLDSYSKFVQFSGQVPDTSDSGYSISGDGQAFGYNIPSTTFTAKIQMILGGNGISFDRYIDDTANNAQMELNYTTYCVGTPVLLGTNNGTGSGFVSTTTLNVPTASNAPTMKNYSRTLPDIEKPMLESETTNDVKTWLAAQNLEVAVEDTLRSTDGYAQTTFESSRSTAVYDDDTTNIVGVYEPDGKMLPDPNTDCYFEMPVDFKPVVTWEEYQYSYQKLSVWMHRSRPFLVFWGNELTCQSTDVTNTVFPMTFIKSKQVHNMFYLQKVRVPIFVASVYKFVPNGQITEPLVPPNMTDTDPQLPSGYTGDTNVTIILRENESDWDKFWNSITTLFSIPRIFGFGVLLGVVAMLLIKFILSIFGSKTKMIKKLAKLSLGGPLQAVKVLAKNETAAAQSVNLISAFPEHRNNSVYMMRYDWSKSKKFVICCGCVALGCIIGSGINILIQGWIL